MSHGLLDRGRWLASVAGQRLGAAWRALFDIDEELVTIIQAQRGVERLVGILERALAHARMENAVLRKQGAATDFLEATPGASVHITGDIAPVRVYLDGVPGRSLGVCVNGPTIADAVTEARRRLALEAGRDRGARTARFVAACRASRAGGVSTIREVDDDDDEATHG